MEFLNILVNVFSEYGYIAVFLVLIFLWIWTPRSRRYFSGFRRGHRRTRKSRSTFYVFSWNGRSTHWRQFRFFDW